VFKAAALFLGLLALGSTNAVSQNHKGVNISVAQCPTVSEFTILIAKLDQYEGVKLAYQSLYFKAHTSQQRESLIAVVLEYKKWLILKKIGKGSETFPMLSPEVDEVWHTHILYTKQYRAETQDFFGKYLDHSPGIQLSMEQTIREREKALKEFGAFRIEYERIFCISMQTIPSWHSALKWAH
jgi:hypothetical protein